MFKRENRLERGVRFNNSNNFFAPEFVLKEKRNGLLLNRFGIVVAKKIDKRAVVRNKIKRIFRASLVDLNKDISTGHDMLFIVKLGILKKNKDEIQALLKKSLQESELLK